MNVQRVRNLTTGILHTKMEDIYKDIEYIIGDKGIMTHMLPNAREAMLPYLRKYVTTDRFWNKEFDTNHIGDIEIPPMNDVEKDYFWQEYGKLPNPLDHIGEKA